MCAPRIQNEQRTRATPSPLGGEGRGGGGLDLRRAVPQPQLRTIQVPLRTWAARAGILDAADVPAAPAVPIWPTGADYPIVKSPVSFAATGQPMVLVSMQRREFIKRFGGAVVDGAPSGVAGVARKNPRNGFVVKNHTHPTRLGRQGCFR